MKCNVGGMDRTGRIVLGIVLLVVGLLAPIEMMWRIVALVVAAVALTVGSSPSARTQPCGCAGAISVCASDFNSVGLLARGSNRSGNVLGIGASSEGDSSALPGSVLRVMDLHHHAGHDLGHPPGAADNFNPWSS